VQCRSTSLSGFCLVEFEQSVTQAGKTMGPFKFRGTLVAERNGEGWIWTHWHGSLAPKSVKAPAEAEATEAAPAPEAPAATEPPAESAAPTTAPAPAAGAPTTAPAAPAATTPAPAAPAAPPAKK
jgi:hypothetical protein